MKPYSIVVVWSLALISTGAFCMNSMAVQPGIQKLDSLKQQLVNPKNTVVYATLAELVFTLSDDNNSEALTYAKRAQQVAIDASDTTQIIESTRWVGQLTRRMGDNMEGIRILSSALNLANRSRSESEILRLSNSLGVAFSHAGRYDSALRYYLRVLRIRTQRDEPKEIGITLNNIGLLFYQIGDFQEAKRFFESSVKSLGRAEEIQFEAEAMANAALALAHLRDIKQATELVAQADSLCSGKCNSYFKLSSNFAKAECLLLQTDYRTAAVYFQTVRDLAVESGDEKYEVDAMIGLARCLVRMKKHGEAKDLLVKCEQKAREDGYDQLLISTYENLIPILRGEGDLHSVDIAMSELLNVKNRVFHETLLSRVSMARVEFEEYQNQMRLASQALILESNQKALTRQKWVVALVTTLAALLTVLAIVLYRFSMYQSTLSAILDRRVTERTNDLQVSESLLVRKLGEQRALLDLISTRLRASIATLRGLWNIVSKGDEVKQQFEVVALDLLQVSRIIDRNRKIDNGDAELPNSLVSSENQSALQNHKASI